MRAWIFPGQPLRCESIGEVTPELVELDQLSRDLCGYDLVHCLPCAASPLTPHTVLQIHGVASSLYRIRCLKKSDQTPDLIAEHSLGIYAALSAAGCISEGEALMLSSRIGSCMSWMGSTQDYALGCPIGLTAALVEAAARNNGVFIANYNTSSHFLLAGRRQGIESALAECQAAGAFSVSLFPCEAPLHTPLMAEIAEDLAAIVADYSFADPIIPLIEHVEQTCLTAAAIPDFLVNELCQPVWWERSYKSLLARGTSHFVEVGSGNALKKFNRWIDSEAVPL